MKLLELANRHRNSLLFACAVGLGGLAAFGARGYISEQLALERERLAPRTPMAQVVVAKRDLAKGETASADTMAVREVPREYLSASAVTPERFDGFAGARLTAPMRAGEPLLAGALEGADPSTFAAKVPSGIRAITVAVDEVNSLSGMLQPGDRIDLLLSVRMPGGVTTAPLAQEITRPLMQDVRVLATGRQIRPGYDERSARAFTAITIEVSPTQAQKLVVAQRIGKLTAMLRNPEDRKPIDAHPMDVYGLLDIKPVITPPLPRAPRPPELIVGGQGPLKVRDALTLASGTTPRAPATSTPPAAVASTPAAMPPASSVPGTPAAVPNAAPPPAAAPFLRAFPPSAPAP